MMEERNFTIEQAAAAVQGVREISRNPAVAWVLNHAVSASRGRHTASFDEINIDFIIEGEPKPVNVLVTRTVVAPRSFEVAVPANVVKTMEAQGVKRWKRDKSTSDRRTSVYPLKYSY